MIRYNGELIFQEKFSDGTLKCELPKVLLDDKLTNCYGAYSRNTIIWCYDEDSELFTLCCLVGQVRDMLGKDVRIELIMPYIPHARQDRNVSNRLFTLKYFCNIINNLGFERVEVLDPHSDVSEALINNVACVIPNIPKLINQFDLPRDIKIMYPDLGSAKKYKSNTNDIIGFKHRDDYGNLDKFDLYGNLDNVNNVIIVDDICGLGNTVCCASNELRNRGVEKVYLFESHFQKSAFNENVFNSFEGIYTTDSLFNLKDIDEKYFDKLHIIETFRD